MPQVAIQIKSGRDPRTVRQLIGSVTNAVVTSLQATPESVRVIVSEVPSTHWANGDVTLAEKAAEAASVVHRGG